MRLIGHLENATLAERISGFFLSQGIHHLVEQEEARWALWVHSEEDLDRARVHLAAFRANPEDPKFRVAVPARLKTAEPAPIRRSNAAAEESSSGEEGGGFPFAVTVGFIVVCAVVALVTEMGDHPMVRRLQISEVGWRWGSRWDLFLPEVRRGEVWRLISPAILHFGWAHILFNLWAFWDLGRLIEWRRGTGRFLGLVIALGVVSNLGQYMAAGPRFGGMSGVIYGLLGYAWMMGKFRPSAGIWLHPQTVVLMLVWFVVCLSGKLGVPVANTAHGVGLVAGVIWGWWVAHRGD